IGEGSTAADRCLERIKIDHEEIDRRDAMRQHRRLMFRVFPYCQKTAMNLRMQRFHSPIHEFRKAGDIGDIADRKTSVGQRLAGAAGRHKLNAKTRETAREINKAGLVGNGYQRADSAAEAFGHDVFSPRPGLLQFEALRSSLAVFSRMILSKKPAPLLISCVRAWRMERAGGGPCGASDVESVVFSLEGG